MTAENLCHQVIFVDDATGTVMPPDPEMIQIGDAIWQRLQWRGLVQGAVRPVGVIIVAGVTISRIAASLPAGSVPASRTSHARSGHVNLE